jgi:hypothetical protein
MSTAREVSRRGWTTKVQGPLSLGLVLDIKVQMLTRVGSDLDIHYPIAGGYPPLLGQHQSTLRFREARPWT